MDGAGFAREDGYKEMPFMQEGSSVESAGGEVGGGRRWMRQEH